MEAPRITKEDLKKKLDDREDIVLLDVRNPTDYAASGKQIPGAVRMPLTELEDRLGELDTRKEVAAYCT